MTKPIHAPSAGIPPEHLAALSHEFRTPLNGVLGMTRLLDGTRLTAEQRAYVAALRESGEHLLGLVNDILDYAKLGAGRVDLALRGEDRISAGGGDREADGEADREGTDRTARHAGSPRAQRAHSHGGIQHVRPLVAGVDSRSAGREYGANSPQFTCVTENANRHMAFQKSHDCLFEMTPMCLSRWAPNHTDVRTQSHGLVTK